MSLVTAWISVDVDRLVVAVVLVVVVGDSTANTLKHTELYSIEENTNFY